MDKKDISPNPKEDDANYRTVNCLEWEKCKYFNLF